MALRLLYLNGPTVYQIPVDDRQLDAMERQLQALWKAIDRALETANFPPRPNRLCGWCSYQDICPAMSTNGTSSKDVSTEATTTDAVTTEAAATADAATPAA